VDQAKIELVETSDRNLSIACELGVCYPTLRVMLNREDLHLHISVSSYFINNTVIYLSYASYIASISLTYFIYNTEISLSYASYIASI
jgi:hypothetical protein